MWASIDENKIDYLKLEVTRQMKETTVKTQQMLENTRQLVKEEIRLDVEAKIKLDGVSPIPSNKMKCQDQV